MRSESKIAEWCRGAESARVTAVGAGAPHRRLIALTGPRSADELGEDLGRVALHTRRRSLPRHPRLRCLVNRGAYLVPILIAALLNSTGCSALIASRGISQLPAIHEGSTREEVRRLLGAPEASELRDDGTRLETYRIRRKVTSWWSQNRFDGGLSVGGPGAAVFWLALVVAAEGYATVKAISDSEKQKYHLAALYGTDDRLLASYQLDAPPSK